MYEPAPQKGTIAGNVQGEILMLDREPELPLHFAIGFHITALWFISNVFVNRLKLRTNCPAWKFSDFQAGQ